MDRGAWRVIVHRVTKAKIRTLNILNRLIGIENKPMAIKSESRGAINSEVEININTLLYTKQINIKDLLDSSGSYILFCNNL